MTELHPLYGSLTAVSPVPAVTDPYPTTVKGYP